jgi:hypothetical protein
LRMQKITLHNPSGLDTIAALKLSNSQTGINATICGSMWPGTCGIRMAACSLRIVSICLFLDVREAGETCSKHRVVRLMRVNKIRVTNSASAVRFPTLYAGWTSRWADRACRPPVNYPSLEINVTLAISPVVSQPLFLFLP